MKTTESWWLSVQCDHMARLFVQFMAFYNNENLPNGIFFTKYFAKYQINPDKLPKTYVSVPKWQNFAKYGHTDCDKLLQVVPTYVATS